jgi:hypothetical protein
VALDAARHREPKRSGAPSWGHRNAAGGEVLQRGHEVIVGNETEKGMQAVEGSDRGARSPGTRGGGRRERGKQTASPWPREQLSMVEKMQTSAMTYEIPSSIETTGRRRTTGRCWGWHRKRSGWLEVIAR